MKFNYINISTNLITNFKPQLTTDFKDYILLKQTNKQIYCKNFLMYLLLFKYKSSFFIKSNLHIKKYKKKLFTILRSPYRHKLARHQISLNRYKINFVTKIKISNKIIIKNMKNIIYILNFLKNFNKIFESNLIYVNNINFNFDFKFFNNFILKKY